jgi:hypothetical protein
MLFPLFFFLLSLSYISFLPQLCHVADSNKNKKNPRAFFLFLFFSLINACSLWTSCFSAASSSLFSSRRESRWLKFFLADFEIFSYRYFLSFFLSFILRFVEVTSHIHISSIFFNTHIYKILYEKRKRDQYFYYSFGRSTSTNFQPAPSSKASVQSFPDPSNNAA